LGIISLVTFHACQTAKANGFIKKLEDWTFSPEPAAVHEAWNMVSALLVESGIPATHETRVVVDELAANAIVHAKTEFKLVLEIWQDGLRVIVQDRSKLKPRLSYPDPLAESGRGLFLLNDVAQDWGYHLTEDGKCIWANVALAS